MNSLNIYLASAIVAANMVVSMVVMSQDVKDDDPLSYGNSQTDIHAITEFIDGQSTIPDSNKQRAINLTASWDLAKDHNLTVSIMADDDLSKGPILEYSKSVIFDSQNIKNATNHHDTNSSQVTSWIEFLSSLNSDAQVYPRIVNGTTNNADIRITLTNDEHPFGSYGQATLLFGDDKRISHVEIIAFSAERLYDEGLLGQVLVHELGHALGLSHSNDLDSIMYPRMVIRDDVLVGTIGDCETAGLSALYEYSKVGTISCE